MKTLAVLITIFISATASAKGLNVNCSGKGLHDDKMSTFTVTFNTKDGLKVVQAADDGMSSSSMQADASKVKFWNEGGAQALGVAGVKVFLLSNTEATLYRMQYSGTLDPNGEYVQLACK